MTSNIFDERQKGPPFFGCVRVLRLAIDTPQFPRECAITDRLTVGFEQY